MGISTYEAVTLLPALSYVLGRGFLTAFLAPLRSGRARTKPYAVYLQQSIFKTLFHILTPGQLGLVLGGSLDNYQKYQKSIKKPVEIEKIPGTKISGAWFGDKNKAKVIAVYYHGGGFAMPAMDLHAAFLGKMVEWNKGDLAIFMPAYTTTAEAHYPQALGEVVEATRLVLEGVGKDKDVIIGGDSAGGQLALAILSHVSGHEHPNKAIVKPLDLHGRKFKGVFLIAPWVSSDTKKFPSMIELSQTDMIDEDIAKYWSAEWKKGKPDDEYIVPEIAPVEWWEGPGDCVSTDVLATAGNDECLRDAIKSWAAKFEQAAGKDKIRLVIGHGESHDEPLTPKPAAVLEKEVPGSEKTQEGALKNWLKKQCA